MDTDTTQTHTSMPSGTVTFLFTDIEGSTKLLERIREDFRAVISEHNALFRAAFVKWNGREIQFLGDGFHAAFRRATDAVGCVAELQRALAEHTWPADATVRVRMGLNTGEAEVDEDHYVGIGVHRAARVAAAGHGGQVLLSQTTRDLVYMDLPLGVSLRDLGAHMLKDIRFPQPIYQLDIEGLRQDFPPLRTLGTEEPPAPGEAPYKGLQYFTEADAEWFFGRDETAARLAQDLRDWRFLAVVGASGSGKSSVVRAGLLPALRRSQAGPPHVLVITPTAHPLESLATGLTRGSESVTAAATLMDDMARDSRSLHLFVRRSLTPIPSPMNRLGEGGTRSPSPHLSRGEGWGEGRFLLVVDQFEELFTQCRSEAERCAFVDNLLYAAQDDGGATSVVIALRADFYDHLAPYPALREAVAKHQEYIGPMSADELRQAIEQPAKRGGWEFVPGLVELMLADVGAGAGQTPEPGALPLLSHALLETWKRRRGNSMTLRGYNEAGGVRGAIAQTAETVYQQGLTPQQQAIARSVFLRLTELGEGTQDTRRRATLSELIPPAPVGDAVQLEEVLVKLADARLITTGEGTVEVAHEALIREWPTLRAWLAEDRDGLRLHRHLTQAAQEWETLARDAGALYRGSRLVQAAEWAQAHPGELNALEQAFLAASQAQAQREEAEREAQRRRELLAAQQLAEAERQHAEEQTRAAARLRQRAVYLAAALIAAAGLLVAAVWLGQAADRNARAAQEQASLASSRELAAAALNNLAVDPERSALLALRALDQAQTLEAANALHQALPELRLLRTIKLAADVDEVAFSPDGSLLATAHSDHLTIFWDSRTGKRLLGLSSTDPVRDIAFRPDGQVVALGGLSQVLICDVANQRHLFALGSSVAQTEQQFWESDPGVGRLAFHPGGARLAVANMGGLPKVYDLSARTEVITLTGHVGKATAIAYSPDGARLVTGGEDQSVRIWDAATGAELRRMQGSPSPSRVVFSPDGLRVAAVGADGTLTVWDAASGQRLFNVAGQAIGFRDVAYTPDGKQWITAGSDGTARTWDATSGLQVRVWTGHKSEVRAVAISPDGRLLATCSDDGTAKLWDNGPGRELLGWSGHAGWATGAAYSPDGALLATSGTDNALKLWDPATGEPQRSLTSESQGGLYSLCFDADGGRLGLGSGNGSAGVWDLSMGKQVLSVTLGADWVTDIAFSPDGVHLAACSRDGRVALWDATSGERLAFGDLGAGTELWGLAFSPDGKLVAGGGSDGYVHVWDWATASAALSLNEGAAVYSVAWSRDGRRLACGSQNGSVTIWDASSGQRLLSMAGHTGTVLRLAFSPDGSRLASAAMDGLAKVWDVASGAEVATLYGNTTSVYGVAFHPDGIHLATAALDGSVRTYTLQTQELLDLARSRLTRQLTDEECQKFLHLSECP